MELFPCEASQVLVMRFVNSISFTALALAIATNQHLFSQPPTVSLCIVDTRPHQVGPYDPPAGPFAIGMYQQLDGQKLKNGSDLHITVFPASHQPEILPEVRRLDCSWVLQLWYHLYANDDAFGQSQPRGARFDTLTFALWNGATQKVVESGGGLVSLREPKFTPYASFSKQILNRLNQQR